MEKLNFVLNLKCKASDVEQKTKQKQTNKQNKNKNRNPKLYKKVLKSRFCVKENNKC